ncbi:MAG: type II toxin-antitoxin system HipA family toxin [Lysobacter sp.]
MNGEFVGTWRLGTDGRDILEYDQDWQTSSQGRPLSLSLPFTPGTSPHRGEAVRSYFDNLLPDSQDIRARAASRFGARSTDAFDLLAQIGRDCVGALQLLPDGTAPGDVDKVEATPLDEHDVAAILRGTVAPPALAGAASGDDDDFRISIAGAQEKTALLSVDGQWCRPHGATPTTHILKLPMGLVGNMRLDLNHSIENEWLCARILAAFGLPVADCEPLQFEDIKVLSVTRFDRAWRDGPRGRWLARLPQEDFCQATGTPATLKYESDGGPGIDRIMGLLATSASALRDRRTFFLAQLLFWMLSAPDGHAKNFSLAILPKGAYALTPLYDVMSAWPVIGEAPDKLSAHKVKLAMAIRTTNAHWKMKDIQPRHWVEIAKRYGVLDDGGRSVEALIDEVLAAVDPVITKVEADLPAGFPEQVAASIFQGLRQAARKFQA